MSTLYSLNGAAPTPLPFRIHLANGFTRTDPSTFTEEEIAEVGFVAIETPDYDPATQALNWNGASFDVVSLPPAPSTPRWVDFSAAAMGDSAVNAMLGQLLQQAPGLYGGLIIGLKDASTGEPALFLRSWAAIQQAGLIDQALSDGIVAMAVAHDLPESFVEALSEGAEVPEEEVGDEGEEG